jgi:hypothetical protein
MDQGIKVESRKVWIFRLDIHDHGSVVYTQLHLARTIVIEMREGNSVLCSQRGADNKLVDIIKFIPVLISFLHISVQRLKLWTSCTDKRTTQLERQPTSVRK